MLPKENRLNNERDFKRVYQKGQKFSGSFFYGKSLANRAGNPRFGIVISAKISKSAVVRNKIKRQIRAGIKAIIKNDELRMTRPQSPNDSFGGQANYDIIISVNRLPDENINVQNEIELCLKNLFSR